MHEEKNTKISLLWLVSTVPSQKISLLSLSCWRDFAIVKVTPMRISEGTNLIYKKHKTPGGFTKKAYV